MFKKVKSFYPSYLGIKTKNTKYNSFTLLDKSSVKPHFSFMSYKSVVNLMGISTCLLRSILFFSVHKYKDDLDVLCIFLRYTMLYIGWRRSLSVFVFQIYFAILAASMVIERQLLFLIICYIYWYSNLNQYHTLFIKNLKF